MANVALAGFPPVFRVSLFQGSGARPGRVVVDSMIAGAAGIATVPKITTMTIAATDFLGTWNDLRVVKSPRVKRNFMRTVLEDSRWKLRDTVLAGNYNRLDMRGQVASGTQKTLAQLFVEIANASSVPMVTGTLPNLTLPASWSGERADRALSRLLYMSGCRMVYNPVTGIYGVSQAGSGTLPAVNSRLFRPGPPPQFKNLVVWSAPVLFEDRLVARAAKLDFDGSIIADPVPTLPDDGDFSTQANLRLWQPSEVSHPEVLDLDRVVINPHRAASTAPGAWGSVMVAPEMFLEDWEIWPAHREAVVTSNRIARKVIGSCGGEAVLFDQPVLGGNGAGGFKNTGKLLTSYYVKDTDGSLIGAYKTVAINPTATGDLVRYFDWITPVVSTEPDMATTQWDAIHTAVTSAISSRYMSPPQTLRLRGPINLGGSGQVGAVHYLADLRLRRFHFTAAFNFDPKDLGSSQLS